VSLISFHTHGCKVNTYDTGLLENQLNDVATSDAHVHVINSCAVTAQATLDVVKQARRLKRKQPDSKVVVTGCSAQVDHQILLDAPEIDIVVANSHKPHLREILQDHLSAKESSRSYIDDIFKNETLGEGGGLESAHTRAYLKIQDGCNSFCTFCVIPFARGRSRSLSVKELCERANSLYQQGAREIVLTGVHVGDYENTNGESKVVLEDLVSEMLKRTEVPRYRISSLEPIELTDRLLDLYSDERLCPHFHMSIQSASTKVLHEMKRKYTAEDVKSALTRIRQKLPSAYIGMDVIAGFPGETDEEFLETCENLRSTPWTRIHVFPYSERSRTKAAQREDQIPVATRMSRAEALRELSHQRAFEEAERQIGLVKRALVLRNNKERGRALTRDYWNLEIDQNDLSVNEELEFRIVAISDRSVHNGPILKAEVVCASC